jgi:asparagine synthetase B (glutamine-hydrolysing)
MIVGAIAPNDRTAARILDRLASSLPTAVSEQSIENGIAIASWTGPGVAIPPRFVGDYACVGDSQGPPVDDEAELAGDFALVARHGGMLRLVRGRFCGRPLYWLRYRDAVVACSRLLPLATLLRGELRLNLDHLFALFDLRLWAYRPPPFEGVACVQGNTVVDVNRSGRVGVRFGTLRVEPELKLPPRELAQRLQAEFRAAVGRQCAGARRIAVFSGGGVDSSNLLSAAVLNERERGAASVIPIAFDYGGIGDDRPHLRALCRHLNVEPLRVASEEGAPYAHLERVIDASAHAVGPASSLFAAMTRARSAGAELTLMGEGAEAVFDSDPAIFAHYLLHSPLRALACAARFRGVNATRWGSVRRLVVGPIARTLVPERVLDARRRLVRWRREKAGGGGAAWAGPRLTAFFRDAPERPVPKAMYSQRERIAQLASAPIPMAVGEHLARWEVATGLAIRRPYLDDRFVQFVGRIPSGALFAGGRERGLLRESMAGAVPDSVRYRTDKARPFQAFEDLFRAMGGSQAVEELVTMRELASLEFVNPDRYRAAFERFAADPSADPSAWSTLWGPLTAEAYLRWFNDFNTAAATSRPAAASVL